jgi:hypothetical protein
MNPNAIQASLLSTALSIVLIAALIILAIYAAYKVMHR